MIPETLTKDIIKSTFNEHIFQRGQQYHEDGRVVIFEVEEINAGKWKVAAEVHGSEPYPYDVDIVIKKSGNRFNIRGECDCPMTVNCKHVVATLLTLIAQGGNVATEINFERLRSGLTVLSGHPKSTSYEIEHWLNEIERKHQPVHSRSSSQADYQVFYELSQPGHHQRVGKVLCRPLLYKLLKSGQRSKTKKQNLLSESNQAFITAHDRTIIGRILVEKQLKSPYATREGEIEFVEASGEAIIEDILTTGRCCWAGLPETIKAGETRQLSFYWHTLPDGTQRLQHDQSDKLTLFKVHQLWYLDLSSLEMGRVESNLPASLIDHIFNMPDVPVEKSIEAQKALKKIMPDSLLPVAQKISSTLMEAPIPCLHLAEKELCVAGSGWRYEKIRRPVATVSFRYGVTNVPWHDARETVHSFRGQDLVQYKRDFPVEEAAMRHLTESHSLFLIVLADDINSPELFDGFSLDKRRDPVEFTLHSLPALRAAGWQIDIDAKYPHDILDANMDEWYANLEEEGSGIDWFSFELGILLPSGEKINLLPILQRYLLNPPKDPTKVTKFITQLDDGRKICLPLARVQQAAETLIDIFSRTTGSVDKLRLSRLEAARLAELEKALNAAKLRWHGGQKLLEMAEKLSKKDGLEEIAIPGTFHGQLRPYQQKGLNWLQFIRENQFGGILSDDMGLGKTIQAIAHITVEKQMGRLQNPVLIIAPTSLMFNWQTELERFSPDLTILLLHGAQRKQHHDKINQYDVVLTTYPLLSRDKEVLLQHPFHLLILDEAQAIKNFRTQAAEIVIQLRANHRLCMTGTPMENHLGELWSLFHFMMPGFLGTEKQFRSLFRIPIEREQNDNRRHHLARIISPFLLRRKKADVVKELPDKVDIVQAVDLDAGQRDLYETIRLSMQKKLRDSIKQMGLARSHIMILDALLKLRQICCDPRLLKEDKKAHQQPSAKLALLMSMLPELVEEGRRILLFSQFTGMLSLIEKELTAANIPYVILTGQTKDRKTPVMTFQSGKVPVFLISLKAGGTGLNLTAADTVIHYDPWWNPAAENQATDRAHRIGQDKKVFVYRLVTKGTVEEKIVELQQRKHALAEGLLDKNVKNGPAFSMDDLQILLGPMV